MHAVRLMTISTLRLGSTVPAAHRLLQEKNTVLLSCKTYWAGEEHAPVSELFAKLRIDSLGNSTARSTGRVPGCHTQHQRPGFIIYVCMYICKSSILPRRLHMRCRPMFFPGAAHSLNLCSTQMYVVWSKRHIAVPFQSTSQSSVCTCWEYVSTQLVHTYKASAHLCPFCSIPVS